MTQILKKTFPKIEVDSAEALQARFDPPQRVIAQRLLALEDALRGVRPVDDFPRGSPWLPRFSEQALIGQHLWRNVGGFRPANLLVATPRNNKQSFPRGAIAKVGAIDDAPFHVVSKCLECIDELLEELTFLGFHRPTISAELGPRFELRNIFNQNVVDIERFGETANMPS